MRKRNVGDLYVQCSLQLRNLDTGYSAMSDCCGKHATSAVVMEDGNQMWRCEGHRGIRTVTVGPFVTQVELECEEEYA